MSTSIHSDAAPALKASVPISVAHAMSQLMLLQPKGREEILAVLLAAVAGATATTRFEAAALFTRISDRAMILFPGEPSAPARLEPSSKEGSDAVHTFAGRFERACEAFHEVIEGSSYSNQAWLVGELAAFVARAGESKVLTPKAFIVIAANAANVALREGDGDAA